MKGSEVRDEDFLEHLFVATNHNYLLFFTEKGKCFWMRAFEIPEGSKPQKEGQFRTSSALIWMIR
jgi:DNA gyrase subunit A